MTLSDDVSTNNIAASILSLTGQDLVTSNDLLLFYLTFTERLSLREGREFEVGLILVELEKLWTSVWKQTEAAGDTKSTEL